MFLHIDFLDDGYPKPKVVIQTKLGYHSVDRARWMQLLTLLAYRRLTGQKGGEASLKDFSHLKAFRNLKPKAIGKYLSNSSSHFPPKMTRFIKYCLNLNTTGPYQLILSQNQISTDINKLEKYINWIYSPSTSERIDKTILNIIDQEAFQNFELTSSRRRLESYIKAAKLDKRTSAYDIAQAYIRLAEIDRRALNKSLTSLPALIDAKKCA